jgi:N-acetylneuraminic acid mutarotase
MKILIFIKVNKLNYNIFFSEINKLEKESQNRDSINIKITSKKFIL